MKMGVRLAPQLIKNTKRIYTISKRSILFYQLQILDILFGFQIISLIIPINFCASSLAPCSVFASE